jgi:hypothetical protein
VRLTRIELILLKRKQILSLSGLPIPPQAHFYLFLPAYVVTPEDNHKIEQQHLNQVYELW